MNQQTAKRAASASRPAMTLKMALCGLIGAVSMGAASAATVADEPPSVVVQYRPAALVTDSGTRALYRRLVTAAKEACPTGASSPFVNQAIQDCRDQAVARAVRQIGSPGLAALHAGNTKNG
jgi:UrcA family protein